MSDTTPASTPSFDEAPSVQTDAAVESDQVAGGHARRVEDRVSDNDGLGDESALPENYEDARVVDDPGADADPDVEPTLRP